MMPRDVLRPIDGDGAGGSGTVDATTASEDASACPICLHRPPDAVVLPCVHFFCEGCATTWFVGLRKRQCPLCKAAASSLLTRISRDGAAFLERRLPGAERRPSRWDEGSAAAASADEDAERRRRWQEEAARAAARAAAAVAAATAAANALLPPPTRRPAALPDVEGHAKDYEEEEGEEQAGAAPTIGRADRRAFYRSPAPPAAPVSPAADPRGRLAIAAAAASAPRVRRFARRDLRALLLPQEIGSGQRREGEENDDDEEDEGVALLLEHALGLLRRYGPAPAAAGGNEDDGADTDADRAAIGALQPLLFEHAPRFWAELSAFARSGLSIEAFDRLRFEQHQQARRRRRRAAAAPTP